MIPTCDILELVSKPNAGVNGKKCVYSLQFAYYGSVKPLSNLEGDVDWFRRSVRAPVDEFLKGLEPVFEKSLTHLAVATN